MTAYLVQIKRNVSGDPWLNCPSYSKSRPTFCLFTNLEKDNLYEVRVMAKNNAGYGGPSQDTMKTGSAGNRQLDLLSCMQASHIRREINP